MRKATTEDKRRISDMSLTQLEEALEKATHVTEPPIRAVKYIAIDDVKYSLKFVAGALEDAKFKGE